MCEYCNCQEIDAIAVLTAEHDAIRSAGSAARRAAARGDHAAAVAGVERLADLLEPHTRIEEIGLFPPMAAEFGDHVAGLEQDHRDLERDLAELAAAPGLDAAWIARLDAALAELFEHILREQDGLFPATLAVLEPADWDRLDDVRREVEHDRQSREVVTG